jgi:hypothetical protein
LDLINVDLKKESKRYNKNNKNFKEITDDKENKDFGKEHSAKEQVASIETIELTDKH